MKEVTLEIRSESLAKFGGAPDAELHRIFLKFDDSEVEIYKTTDCPRHYVTRNHDAHYCLATGEKIHKLPSPPKCLLMCTEICPYKKQILRTELDKHGTYYSEKARTYVEEYLRKDNTVTWAISSDG